ncbi:MAG: FG-GAP-like repeat-containing protein [Bacteroidota bacterium]
MMRFIPILIVLLTVQEMSAQPFINSVDPIAAGVGETITLVGSGFSTTVTENQVYLGAGKATITSATVNTLTLQVPESATSGPIFYTNLNTDLSATFSKYFIYTFGNTTFSTANLATPFNLSTGEVQTYDICTCDFDGDGDNDVAVTNNEAPASSAETSELLVYENTSTPVGGVSFAGPVRLGDDPTIKLICLDLTADGFPELIATEGASSNDEVFIYENTGSGSLSTSFPTTPTIALLIPRDDANTIRNPEVIQSADMDGDGRIDLVVGNATNQEVDIFLNESSGGSLSFQGTPFQIQGPSGAGALRGVALGDLNGDNTPEVVLTELSSDNIYIYNNESVASNLNFGGPTTINVPNAELRNVVLGDLNSDGLMDIAATDVQLNRDNGNVVIAQNSTTTTGSQPTFDNPIQVQTLPQCWGIAVSDIDGDGDLDLAVASEDEEANGLNVVINNITAGADIAATDFSTNNVALSFNSRNIVLSDLNGDAKTDLAFTSNSRTGQVGFLSVIVNNNCVIPSITPDTDFFCNGVAFEIEAVNTIASSYTWEVDAGSGFVVDGSSTTNTFDISGNTTDIQVRAQLQTDDGLCSVMSDPANFTVRSISVSTPTITSTTSLCSGDDLVLSTSSSATNFYWTGPNGFDSVATSSSIAIPSSTPANGGTYELQIEDSGSCKSPAASAVIEVLPVPVVTVINQGEDTFCEGESTTLQIRDIGGVTYQWRRDSTDIAGATTTSITADTSADYRVILTQAGCNRPSEPITITEVPPPAAQLNAADEICIDVALSLSSSSEGEDGFTINELWEYFDPAGNSVGRDTGTTVTHTYTTAGSSSATLTVEYIELPGCLDTATSVIAVSEIPELPILTPDGNQKCPSDSLALEVDTGQLSYDWIDISTGLADTLTQFADQNLAFINTTDGRSTATVTVTILTPIGCVTRDTTTIEDFANSGISIVSDDLEIIDGTITIPAMANGVNLRASNGSNFLWEPRVIFTDSTGSQTTAFPRSSMTEVTLSAVDVNGCNETDNVTLLNNNLLPRTGFSPNGDGLGFECWEILNSSTVSGCKVHIFDSRGRNILVADSPFEDDCVWNGTSSGADSPIGIYYFVLECEDEQLSQSGSILLAR